MSEIAIAVHGGASDNSPFIQKHWNEVEDGLKEATRIGYSVLSKGGSALDAVEEAVKELEDNYLFNAGRGSALNNKGEVEMDAAIMDGKTLQAGAVSIVKRIKNPISLARIVMLHTKHVLVAGYGALELAQTKSIELEPDSYFITTHQFEAFLHENKEYSMKALLKKKLTGTVGAVALDKNGNIAAATSTGGTTNALPGRIGDSCIIGAGCYANNHTCAISGTGEGEYLIRGVIANTISMLVETKNYTLQEACDEVIHKRNKGDVGVIAVNKKGEVAISFNTEVMKRAWKTSKERKIHVHIS